MVECGWDVLVVVFGEFLFDVYLIMNGLYGWCDFVEFGG